MVLGPILVYESSLAMLFAIAVFSGILHAVGPNLKPCAVHPASMELACVLGPVGPDVLALPVEIAPLSPLPAVNVPVRRGKHPVAVLLALPELALVYRSISPCLLAFPMLFVVQPLALVHISILGDELALATKLSVHELAGVLAIARVIEGARAMERPV